MTELALMADIVPEVKLLFFGVRLGVLFLLSFNHISQRFNLINDKLNHFAQAQLLLRPALT